MNTIHKIRYQPTASLDTVHQSLIAPMLMKANVNQRNEYPPKAVTPKVSPSRKSMLATSVCATPPKKTPITSTMPSTANTSLLARLRSTVETPYPRRPSTAGFAVLSSFMVDPLLFMVPRVGPVATARVVSEGRAPQREAPDAHRRRRPRLP